MDCKVNIYDKNNKLLFTKNTNKNGEVNFTYTHKEVNIEAFGSMGHKNKISYEGENEIVSIEENESYTKMLLSLLIIAVLFFILKLVKK